MEEHVHCSYLVFNPYPPQKRSHNCPFNITPFVSKFYAQDASLTQGLDVAGGTIHQRVAKLKDAGVITGSHLSLDYRMLGFDVMAFVGVSLGRATAVGEVQGLFKKIPEIVAVHFTTGTYSLLVKVVVRTMADLYELLSDKLQSCADIQSTEAFVILDTEVSREPEL